MLDPIVNHPCVSHSNPVSLQTAKPFKLGLLKTRWTLAYLSGALLNLNNQAVCWTWDHTIGVYLYICSNEIRFNTCDSAIGNLFFEFPFLKQGQILFCRNTEIQQLPADSQYIMYLLKKHFWNSTVLPTGEIQLAIVKDCVKALRNPTFKQNKNTQKTYSKRTAAPGVGVTSTKPS